MYRLTNQWFAIYVRPRNEQAVAAALRAKGYEEFLPMCRKKHKKPRENETPLFPNYVFCRLNHEICGPIVTTPGVIRIVGFGGQPYPIDPSEINAIQMVVSSNVEAKSCSYLALGERIEIKEGPLAGVCGWITRIGNKARLVVSVHLLQRSVFVEIDSSSVEPVSSPMFLAG